MSPLAALVLATPIFGFSLTPPTVAPLAPAPSFLSGPVLAQLDDVEVDPEGTAEAEAEPTGGADAPDPEAPRTLPEPEAEPAPRDRASGLGAQIRQRQEIATIHRAFGIATWASMLATVTLGMIQYVNLYGFFGSRGDSLCVQGNAIFGQDQCWGTPWAHRISAITTTALYATTFVLSFVMPDPLGASEGDSELASDLRIHEALRWVHLGGMIIQVVLGFAVGQNWFGLDRANDFEAQRAIATVHQLVGLATFGTLTAAGALMLF